MGEGKEAEEGRKKYIYNYGLFVLCTAENNTILWSNFPAIEK